jgi:hypothetical protein
LTLILRLLARPYLGIYDVAMRLGPIWGPIALGYGPVVLGILAFVFKDRILDPVMDPDTATLAIFLAFAVCGPVMHVGTRIVAENLHHRRNGTWPATGGPGFNRKGTDSPTMVWVEAVKGWSRE